MSSSSQTTTNRNVVVTRVFDAPVESVWKAWTDPEQVMRWWGPTGFSSPYAKIDFREGGVSLVAMRPPKEFGDHDLYNTWTYGKIVPLQQFEFFTYMADDKGQRIDPTTVGIPADFPQGVRSLVTVKTLSSGQTEMTVTEYGHPSDQWHDLSKAGLEQCLDKMAATFH